MARKRMFRLDVLETDAFMDMPLSAQALYFHLGLRADDDGFIGAPKRIVKNVGASDDDFKLLIAKRFVLLFEDGVIVIKHWRLHNTISRNRYVPTAFTDDKNTLRIKDNGAYTFGEGNAIDDSHLIEMSTRQNRVSGGEIIDAEYVDATKTRQRRDKDADSKEKIREDKISKEKKDISTTEYNNSHQTVPESKKTPIRITYFEDEELDNVFGEYVLMRKKLKKPFVTDHAIDLAIRKLEKLSNGDKGMKIAILEQSIENSWLGLFELIEQKGGSGGRGKAGKGNPGAVQDEPSYLDFM